MIIKLILSEINKNVLIISLKNICRKFINYAIIENLKYYIVIID